MTSAPPGMPTTAVPPAAAAVSLSASGGNGRDCSSSHHATLSGIRVSGLKIGILDDYQDVPNTICSVSPDTFGDTAWSRLVASVDCVLGSEKLLE